jgi:hypothetical protein
LAIFACTRVFDAIVIVLLARHQVPLSSLAPGAPMPTIIDPPSYFNVIQSWDGQWYRDIVEHGYPSVLPTSHGQVTQNAWAFYPGYPAVVWVVTKLGCSFGVAASIVSLGSGAAAMCVLYRLMLIRSTAWMGGLTVLALNCAPMAPVLQVAYTGALALLLLFTALLSLERRRYGWMVLAGLALALTRAVTGPLALVVVVELVRRWRRRDSEGFPAREQWTLAGSAVAIGASAAIWPVVVWMSVGDFSAFADTRKAWRDVPGGRPDTWLMSLVHGAPTARWVFVLAVVAVTVASVFYNKQWTNSVRAWLVTYPLYVLAVTPPTSSMFRYLLLVGPGWWPFPESDAIPRERRALVVTGVVVFGLATQVLWLGWFFVITPSSRGIP